MRNRHRRQRNHPEGEGKVDVETSAIFRQLRRKANALIYDGSRLELPFGKQKGEEILALIDMLERKVDREASAGETLVP